MMGLLRAETLSNITKRVMLGENCGFVRWSMIDGDKLRNKLCRLLDLDLFNQESIFLASIIFGVNWYEPIFGVLRVWLIEPFMSYLLIWDEI